MKKVLIVDDSKTISLMLKIEFDEIENAEVIYADSYKSAMRKIRKNKGEIHAALLDVNLPDAPNGEVILLANSHRIPTVVLTGTIDDKVKKIIKDNKVLSYVVKGTPRSTYKAFCLIKNILRNYETTVLVVDDSKLSRGVLSEMLIKNNLKVLEAENGQEAWDILENSKEKISLVFTDFEMPVMNGLELVIKIREVYEKDQLGIIALSDTNKKDTINNFLKFGANDFIGKPFTKEEVSVRVNANLDLLDIFTQISNLANKDFLTGAYNRRYFFDSGEAIFKKAKRKDSSLAVVMLDIDNFKIINDTYGHYVGDIAIKEIKKILDMNLRSSDLMARFGGEEFCVVLEDISKEDVEKLFEKMRNFFEENTIEINDLKIKYTVSFGIAYGLQVSLEDMVISSDKALYHSKNGGRNQVTILEC